MNKLKHILSYLLPSPVAGKGLGLGALLLPVMIWATVSLQDDPRRNATRTPAGAGVPARDAAMQNQRSARGAGKTLAKNDTANGGKPLIKKQVEIEDDEIIPDSLLHPRWGVQKTLPITYDDLDQNPADLQRPENIKQDVVYNDTLDSYVIGTRMGGTWINAPIMMSMQDYLKWSEKNLMRSYFRSKNTEIYESKGKDKFDFTDMHFDLGPAEKIFGPGGVRIKTQGTAELKLGATIKKVDNPSLPISRRKTTNIDFEEKINVNVNGKIGDKVNMNLNYNTDATFDFDQQNMKLKYDGKEDEIIKLVEAGNVSFPSNSSLIQGSSALFGVRTDLQFGKLKLQTVFSQKKSNSSSVSSKGGTQLTPFEIDAANYEENRHFFLGKYFHDIYDDAMQTLPTVTSGVNITRVEIWITNKSGQASNTRNIIALTDLGEATPSESAWGGSSVPVPSNDANDEYRQMVGTYSAARDVEQTTNVLDGISLGKRMCTGGVDYEKLEKARPLTSSEYTLNSALGYISLKTTLQSDQVLAIAYEYTYNGKTYQVGEFSSDITDASQALFVKSLKNTTNSPSMGNWQLMMKNVYYLASNVESTKFRLDVKYQSDTAGVYLNYLPDIKGTPLLQVIGADRLDNNNKAHSNGFYDFVSGYTVDNGRVFLPKVEPFGRSMENYFKSKGLANLASKYCYYELYDTTKTYAKQIAEKDKFMLQGQFKGTSANVISLGSYNVPQGSVTVTAGGVVLTEGSDYSVDYSAGEVTILNQSIIDAGTSISATCESNTDYGQQRKTMFGFNWEYDFSKDFQMSGTFQHLSEQSLTTKVTMGSEPLNNTLWGVNLSWKKESQWLTNMLNKIPFLHVKAPSQIQLNAEFAQLIAGTAGGTQDNASYIDDFEESKQTTEDINSPSTWTLCSIPRSLASEYAQRPDLSAGYNRARLAWYTIDPLFTRSSSTLTPGYIKADADQLSNHYVREVYIRELFPNKDQNNYSGTSSTLSIFNMAFYPNEHGPYNFNPNMDNLGHLLNPENSWGGMMRKINTSDFETANIEYIEFWMLDPFIYTRGKYPSSDLAGDLYFDLGEISEDILPDGKKFQESAMTTDSIGYSSSQWGLIPNTSTTVTYAFSAQSGARAYQDVGFNGLTDEAEMTYSPYQTYLDAVKANVTGNDTIREDLLADPANDDYRYFRGEPWDTRKSSVLERYKYINNPQGNSPEGTSASYDPSYKTTPDVEDINQDYTLNEYEKYFEYHVSIDPDHLGDLDNYCVDKREASVSLRNGSSDKVTWYQFRIPISSSKRETVGGTPDLSSIRFMRVYMKGFKNPIILRFGSFDLVRGEWREYKQNLNTSSPNTGEMSVSAVSIEENNTKTPVNYVLPPGISRVVDPTQAQLSENNEQAMSMVLTNMSNGDAKAVYLNKTLDLRQYRHLQMYAHANAVDSLNICNLKDDQLALFIRLGSDYKSNYYEYEIPLKLTAPGKYSTYSAADCKLVWPEDNMLDIDLSLFTSLKKERNKLKGQGLASYNKPHSVYDTNYPKNKLTVMGNPTLGEIKTLMIGVRNLDVNQKSGEVWVNELRLLDANNEGGWAAQGNLNIQLSDFGSVTATGKYVSEGFGGIEDGVQSRAMDNTTSYSITTNLELGKFFPDKAKVNIPLYYSYTREKIAPKYNPLDTDMELQEALDAASDQHEKDSVNSIAVKQSVSTNFSLSGIKFGIATKRHPMPYDPANFTFSYSHSHSHTDGQTTVYENEDNWRGSMNYSWVPVYKAFEPFKGIKSKSKYFDILKKFALNWLPQNIGFNTEMTRHYYELQERDLDDLGSTGSVPATFSEQFLWNRSFNLRWDLTKNLHASFQSATKAEIEEPYTQVNKELYPDHYQAWKDSVWTSIKHMGTPLDYGQTFTASYQLPLNLIPIFDWLTSDVSYNSTYHWARGAEQSDGSTLGNTISQNRTYNINGTFNLEKFYDHIPFLKKTNERFKKAVKKNDQNAKKTAAKKTAEKKTADKTVADGKEAKDGKDSKDSKDSKTKALPKNSKTFEREITVNADTSITVTHGKKSKRLIVVAKNEAGKVIPVKYKVVDDNKIMVINKLDSAVKMKISVTAKEPLEDKAWYRYTQSFARLMMMVRNVSISYRNQYSLTLPGFMPTVGDVFGQNKVADAFAPGLDFAFGLIDDSFIEKANNNGWLLGSGSSVASPATTNRTEDLQMKVTLEPVRNFKIDLNGSWNRTRAKSVQYMYEGNPTTQSGTFTMTTISIRSAFEGAGNADNGFHSPSFERFCDLLGDYKTMVEEQYAGAVYPSGTELSGSKFSPTFQYGGTTYDTGVDKYSADVMVPAFLKAYTGMHGLSIFPAITKLLPNWSIKYSGLSNITWFQNWFKSVNLNHSYKSIYAVGSYSSYSTFQEFMGDLGFVTDNTQGLSLPRPSSMFNVSQVSINEAFSPLLGVDVTLHNNMTCKLEYKTTRVLNLSMTSVQLNETSSHDWVLGFGYKINDFRLTGGRLRKASSSSVKKGNNNDKNDNSSSSSKVKGKNSFNHDLNLRLDVSLRDQAAITRDIATRTSTASSGNKAFKLSFSADYTMSRLLTMSFYYDHQTNTPLLTASSFPTTTQDFGLSIKFSLTR